MYVSSQLETYRKDLLELDARNPLVNYRTRLKSVELVNESSASVFTSLVTEQRQMGFRPMMVKSEPHLRSTMLQTWLTTEKLQSILFKINSEAQHCLLETSSQVLYLAVGFLHWQEKAEESAEQTTQGNRAGAAHQADFVAQASHGSHGEPQADQADSVASARGEMRKSPLLLIPVALQASEKHSMTLQMSYTGGEILQNPALWHRLSREQGIALPQMDTIVEPDSYFGMLELALMSQPNWRLERDEMVLGLFSFGRLQMYMDLAPERWQQPPDQHPLLNPLLSDEPLVIEDWQREPQVLSPDLLPSLPADDDQLSVLRAVRDGQSLVVFGPPGTGKSQTIANLICDFVVNGRSVLFVSEKQAALDVVKRRLIQLKQGHKLLELHSSMSSREQLLSQITASMAQSDFSFDDLLTNRAFLEQLRVALKDHPKGADPVSEGGLTFQQAVECYLQLWDDSNPLPRLPSNMMAAMTEEQFTVAQSLVDDLAHFMSESGRPANNPFYTLVVEKQEKQPAELLELIQSAFRELAEINSLGKLLAARLWLSAPGTAADLRRLVQVGWRLLELPDVQSIPLGSDEWLHEKRAIERLLSAGEALLELRNQYDDVLKDQAWDLDVSALREQFIRHEDKWWRLESSAFRKAKHQLQQYCKRKLPRTSGYYLRLTSVIREYQQMKRELRQSQGMVAHLFGEHWEGADSNWQLLRQLYEWNVELASDMDHHQLPKESLEMLSSSPELDGMSADLEQVEQVLDKFKARWSQLLELTGNSQLGDWEGISLQQLFKRLQQWDDSIEQIDTLGEIGDLLRELDAAGLGAASRLIRDWEGDPRDVGIAFSLSWYGNLISRAYLEFGHKLLPAQQGSPLQLLLHESQQSRSETSIRSLLQQAGSLVQQLRPVFMMSPLTVSHHLTPDTLSFDLLIFDEASQIRAVDAFGSILRARQMVICGDTKQLPPSERFTKSMELPKTFGIKHESVLTLALTRAMPSIRLNRHYRSRDKSLIAVSNEVFYGNELEVRSSVLGKIKAGGVRFNYLPDTVYERGRSRTNPGEAQAVVEKVIEHAHKQPDQTLGVVTFSTAQRDVIMERIEQMRSQDEALDEYIKTHENEPLFVKHVDNVQGDERDLIYISVGYGRNQEGVIAHNLGAISQPGGERQLNVLITRARIQVEVFANFTADELILEQNAPQGMRALQKFLKFAHNSQVLGKSSSRSSASAQNRRKKASQPA